MSKSQETYLKKEREKKRILKKKQKLEKRDMRRDKEPTDIELDWESAPVNNTLSSEETEARSNIKQTYINK